MPLASRVSGPEEIGEPLPSDRVPLPRLLVDSVASEADPHKTAWLAGLPEVIGVVRRDWRLQVGAPFQPGGRGAWVAPARGAAGDVVLKVAWRHPEAEHEAEGLALWAGEGAVRLHDARRSEDSVALLLERCRPGTALTVRPEPAQDEVIATLLPRLWLTPPPLHPFRPLRAMCDLWAAEFRTSATAERVDPGMARDALSLLRTLPDSADREVLLCTDLHAGNVLAAEREPWLAIDPKPYVGDPTYDLLQHVLNCEVRLRTDPVGLVARLADLVDLDRERLRLWLFARCVLESVRQPDLAAVARSVAPAS